ncbi:MAG TPA: hypothetical protein VFO09_06330 [Methyloceanibacter sp.]|nr:hypothetical protein [Methyloceanibacter sp.]
MARKSKAKRRPASKAKKRGAATTKRASIIATPEKLARAFAAELVDDIDLAWGKKVSPAFKRKVIEISAELGNGSQQSHGRYGIRKRANFPRRY